MDILQVASPAVLLATVLVLILVLWIIHGIDRRLRVLQDHFDSVKRDVEQLEDGLQLFISRGQATPEPINLPDPPEPPEEAAG